MPPTTHAKMTGHMPKSFCSIQSLSSRPMTAAGRKPTMMAAASRSPSGSLPSMPRIICASTAVIEPQHGEDRAALDADGEGVRRGLGLVSLGADAHQVLGDEQVAGRADRQVFGDAFDHAEEKCLPRFHVCARTLGRVPQACKAFGCWNFPLPSPAAFPTSRLPFHAATPPTKIRGKPHAAGLQESPDLIQGGKPQNP